MEYIFNEDEGSLSQRICDINGIALEDLSTDAYRHDRQPDLIREFKEKLLSYKDESFFIVGDYDCDGICAVTIMKRLFDDLGIRANYYIPSRTKEGYGLNKKIVKTAYDNGFGVLLCVDNGVVCKEELALAREYGLKTFVIDHHE